MKKTTILAICMAVLLVGATSGFAAPLWTAPTSSLSTYGEFGETEQFWSAKTEPALSIPVGTP
ncbi:MAG: hypothetical protein Q7U56_00700, partial [Humidesulfovibrio sp.]|nr:hypothetical protein [Humidesulfovibrio sp.]